MPVAAAVGAGPVDMPQPRYADPVPYGVAGRVLRFTVPAGLIIAAATFSAYVLARARGLPLAEQRTAATLVTLVLSLCVLALLAMPLTWRRIALVVAALAAFVLRSPCPPCARSTSSSCRTVRSRAPCSRPET